MSDTLDKKQILIAVGELIQYSQAGIEFTLKDPKRIKLKINTLISDIERGKFDTKEPAE